MYTDLNNSPPPSIYFLAFVFNSANSRRGEGFHRQVAPPLYLRACVSTYEVIYWPKSHLNLLLSIFRFFKNCILYVRKQKLKKTFSVNCTYYFTGWEIPDWVGRLFHFSVYVGTWVTSPAYHTWLYSWCSFFVSRWHQICQWPVSFCNTGTPVQKNRSSLLLRNTFINTSTTFWRRPYRFSFQKRRFSPISFCIKHLGWVYLLKTRWGETHSLSHTRQTAAQVEQDTL